MIVFDNCYCPVWSQLGDKRLGCSRKSKRLDNNTPFSSESSIQLNAWVKSGVSTFPVLLFSLSRHSLKIIQETYKCWDMTRIYIPPEYNLTWSPRWIIELELIPTLIQTSVKPHQRYNRTCLLLILTSFLFDQFQRLLKHPWQSSHEIENAHTLSRQKRTSLIIHLAR